MSRALLNWSTANFIQVTGVRYAWKLFNKGKSPRVALNLKQKLAIRDYKDPSIHYKVDIGFAEEKLVRKDVMTKRMKHRQQVKVNFELQKAARDRTLVVPLADVEEEWRTTLGPRQIHDAAQYYGVYNDLFEDAYFIPVIPLDIEYSYVVDEAYTSSVYRGNILKSYEALDAPKVSYDATDDELFTLVLTTPDCHLTQGNGEYVHWFIGNIPGNKIEAGEECVSYLRPIPPRGTGYCRYIFVLYKQEKKLDLSKYKRKSPCFNLTARTFSTYDFYREMQDLITPAGLAFFQSDWDQTLTHFYHNVLEMKEPSFEYDFKPKVHKEQVWFPERQPFNLYMDRYKEPQVLQRELLLEKLKEVHPFIRQKRPKYPLVHKIDKCLPSWMQDDIKLKRMREGKWKYM